MRIKMQCPDCGAWFTLELGVKEKSASQVPAAHGEAGSEAHAGHEGARTTAAASHARGGAGRKAVRATWPFRVIPVLVAALVLIWFYVVPGTRRSRTSVVAEISAATLTELVGTRENVGEPSGGVVGETVGEPSGGSETALAEEPSGGSETALAEEPLEFVLVAADRCWVRVVADGQVVADLTLEAGETRSWKGRRYFELSAGSGEDVEVYLNGELLGPAGHGSRVVEGLRVTADGFAARS